jgi:hypothetical protein
LGKKFKQVNQLMLQWRSLLLQHDTVVSTPLPSLLSLDEALMYLHLSATSQQSTVNEEIVIDVYEGSVRPVVGMLLSSRDNLDSTWSKRAELLRGSLDALLGNFSTLVMSGAPLMPEVRSEKQNHYVFFHVKIIFYFV